jgi:cobalt/nickel transport system permease protein
VHALDARIKFVLTLAYIFTCALAPLGVWPVFILLFALILAVEILSDLGLRYVLARSALAAPFVLAALPLVFTIPGTPLASFLLGPWQVTISAEGLERLAGIAVKSWLSVQAAIVMSGSMSFPELLTAMRAIRIPRLLVAIVSLMWRYLFILVDEALRLMRARAARSGQSDQPGLRPGGGLLWRARVAGGMAGNLFLRGFERSDRIYMAMLSRGYDGDIRSLPLPPIRRVDWFVLVFGVALFALLLILAFLLR